VTTYDVAENLGRGRIWHVARDGASTPLTASDINASRPLVSPDGKRLAYLVSLEGSYTQLFVSERDDSEPAQVTTLPLGVIGAKWLPDGSGLVVLANVFKGHLSIDASTAEVERRKEAKYVVHVTDDAIYRYWDMWLTTGEVPHLFHLDLASGATRDLTPNSERWWAFPNTDDPPADFDISPDGTRVAFVADSSLPPHRQVKRSLFMVDLQTGEESDLTPEWAAHTRRPRFSPDGRRVAFGYMVLIDFYGDRVRLAMLDLANGIAEQLTEDWDRSADEWEFDGRGDLIFVAEDRGRQHLFRLAIGDQTPVLLSEGGTLSGPAVAPDGTVYLIHHDLTSPPEVVRLDGQGQLAEVTAFARPATTAVEWGRIEELAVPGADDNPIQVILVHPPGGADHSALVHMIHGGPHGVFGDGWQWRWHAQSFAARGYLVAMVNFHGSSSFGQDFAMSIHGAWGDRPYRDIEAVTDHLIGAGLVDESRMAIAGGSYGGYLVSFIIGQTSRYACAVAHAAVTNLGGMYASDVTSGRARAYGAEIWEDRAVVERYSPSSHASGYATPTLVIVSERDYRVPATQGLEFYGVLKAKRVPARLLYYPAENHWIVSPQASLHWYDQVFSWLKLYLNP
jgi:dipeptidyl aminopeptidase/acylaminoacyl peptidase